MTSLMFFNFFALTILVMGVSFLSRYLAGDVDPMADIWAALPVDVVQLWSDGSYVLSDAWLRLVQSAGAQIQV